MMRNRCEASGLIVMPNRDGRATCPLCQTSYNCLTKSGRLRPHVCIREPDPLDVVAVQLQKQRQVEIAR